MPKILELERNEGWLVLHGGGASLDTGSRAVLGRLLNFLDFGLPPLWISPTLRVDGVERSLVQEFQEWLGEEVRRIDLRTSDDDAMDTLVRTSSLTILAGGSPQDWCSVGLGGDQRVLPSAWLREGGVILAFGSAASALGSWCLPSSSGMVAPGWGWIQHALVLPGEGAPMASEIVKDFLYRVGLAYVLGLPEGSILALGPERQVEVWGRQEPVIGLGSGWTS